MLLSVRYDNQHLCCYQTKFAVWTKHFLYHLSVNNAINGNNAGNRLIMKIPLLALLLSLKGWLYPISFVTLTAKTYTKTVIKTTKWNLEVWWKYCSSLTIFHGNPVHALRFKQLCMRLNYIKRIMFNDTKFNTASTLIRTDLVGFSNLIEQRP